MSAFALRTPALVVGAGVAGSLVALELAHHRVPCTVVERASRPPRHPDLFLVNGRSMELLRRLGLADEVRKHGVDPNCPADIVWSEGLDRPPVLVSQLPPASELQRIYRTDADGGAPVEPYMLTSGPALAGRLRQAARDHPLVDLRSGWTLTDVRMEPDGVVATALEASSGIRHAIEASYLAGCDGGQSTVRRCLGVPMEPLGRSTHDYTIFFRSRELTWQSTRPFTIIAGGITLRWGHDGDVCVGHLPNVLDADGVDPAALLQHRIGGLLDPAQVLGVVQRDAEPRVARAYRHGPAFLAGEAAHQFDAPGGIDTSIGDAVDLGWKLAASINGWAGPGLLASYGAERRTRALLDLELSRRALQARRRFARLVSAGVHREVLAAVLRQEPPQMDPSGTNVGGEPACLPTMSQEEHGSTIMPGHRSPAIRLGNGDHLFDRLGPQFTLVDLTSGSLGHPLVIAARARGVPMTHLPIAGTTVTAAWPGLLVLIRPDHQVSWHADRCPPAWDEVLDVVTGHRQEYENT